MINSLNETVGMSPILAGGCCSFSLVLPWLISLATALLAIATIVYLLTKRPEASGEHES